MGKTTHIPDNLLKLLGMCRNGGATLKHNAGRVHAVTDDQGIIHVWITPNNDVTWIEGFDFAPIAGCYAPVLYRADTPNFFLKGGYKVYSSGKVKPPDTKTLRELSADAYPWIDCILSAVCGKTRPLWGSNL